MKAFMFKVGENSFEIQPTKKKYQHCLLKNGKPLTLLEGMLSTAFDPPKIRFEEAPPGYPYSGNIIAIQDAIGILEDYYNNSGR